MSIDLPIDDLNDLLSALASRLNAEGGLGKYFSALDDDAYNAIDISERTSVSRAFLRMIENKDFRNAILPRIRGDDQPLIREFFSLLDIWLELNPEEANWIRARLSNDAYAIVRGPVPATVNAFLEVHAIIALDSRSEEYSVKSGIMLGWASKDIGGDHVFVTSSPLVPFLGSIRMMIEQLKLSNDEIEALRLPADRGEHAAIAREVSSIQDELDALKAQFEKMKR